MSKEKLTLDTPDSKGYIPGLRITGKRYRHYKDPESDYTVIGWTFEATADRWMVEYIPTVVYNSNPMYPVTLRFQRLPEDFFAWVDADTPRQFNDSVGTIRTKVRRFQEIEDGEKDTYPEK
jgi:hypothetical protein